MNLKASLLNLQNPKLNKEEVMKEQFKKNKVSTLRFSKEEFYEIPDFDSFEDIAKSIGVDKVVSVIRLNESVIVIYEDEKEDLNKYYDIDKKFLIKDAEIRLDEFLGLDDPETYDENSAFFEGNYGFKAGELYDANSKHYILDFLAEEFAEKKDCNVADNVTWENIISEELENIKKRGW